MDRKKFIPLLLSSAMAFMWGCGEGEIFKASDDDERVKATLLEKLDSTKKDYQKNLDDFLKPYIEYCKSKKGQEEGCVADVVKSSSSSKGNGGESSKSSSSGNTSKSSSSGNTNTSSSKGENPSSSGSTSSSSKTANSSSSAASSSSVKLETKGKCVLTKPNVVYVGDEISWRYVPDEGSLQEAEFTWSFNDEDAKNWVFDGKITGTGTPELLVKFSTKGRKFGPTLTFNSKGFECDNVDVVSKSDPVSSSSEPESSSSEPESSSAESSSSIAGYCAVSKRKVFVGESVDWYIVDKDGNELEGKYEWIIKDASAEIVSGEVSGTGSTRIRVTYSTPGTKEPIMIWSGNKSKLCNRNELDDDDYGSLLEVEAMPVSSSSEEFIVESSSSGEVEVKSSSSRELDVCDPEYPGYPESCFFDL
ncbi:hypothetical protein [Fibrobacter succinogenes]|uniref:hypothetical protein n=1 Tax=Fibrobacter succinogenes TaxID=833 RepID=UPI001569724C|nr:hypothetical protein [Fibrobacter succinogenes]